MRWMGILTAAIITVAASVSSAGTRDDLWKQVGEAVDKGLPQTAIGVLEQIIPPALADQAYAEATKALCWKIALEGQIQGYKYEEMIVRLEPQIATAPEPMKPVMETVLAQWYWQYFQQNRWRFMQRTATAEPPGEDFTTWDLARILAEIDKHFAAALETQNLASLQTTAIADWGFLLEPGNMPDTCRPTLYDFLAFEALSFYSCGEQAALPEESFEIMADGPVFDPAGDFLQWQPVTANTQSAKFKAVRLYQDLLTFHQNDEDKTAFIDADLHRLAFGYNYALGPEKAERYIAALERLVGQCSEHPLSTMALYQWAKALYDQGDYVRAHELADRGCRLAVPTPKIKAQAWDPPLGNMGADLCCGLIAQIESKSATIQTERVWCDPLPDITVTYRNVTHVYFKVVRFDDFTRPNWWSLSEQQQDALLAAEPALQWDAPLPPTSDYKQRTETLPAPEGLQAGFYFIIASHVPSFRENDGQISVASFWVSDLALVVRTLGQQGEVEGFVLDAQSGRPLAGATVARWKYGKYGSVWEYRPTDQTVSDGNGLFRFTFDGDSSRNSFLIVAEYQGRRLASANTYATHAGYSDPSPSERAVFFTDRSLYRPGQTIHYKGICIRTDSVNDSYQTMAGTQVAVVFHDTNGQEIARQNHVTNDYGSFSGSFIAPSDRLMGRMTISGWNGSASFNVEQYKRPKFYAQLDAPAESPRLNTEVLVPGKATAYTGAAIGGAKVNWHVVRNVRFPYWCWWSRWIAPTSAQAIAHGETITGADGMFEVRFTAKPDLSVPEKDEPIFTFLVVADVTDTTGETRSAQSSVAVGYTALQATLSADAWQTPAEPVKLTITTESLGGQGEAAQGTVRVYTLKQPDKVIRAPFGSYVWRGFTDAGEPQPDPSNPDSWETAELVGEHPFTTNAEGHAALSVALEAGVYRAMLMTQDRFGKAVAARCTITVVDPQAAHFAVRVPNYLAAPKWSIEPGETFTALWGTGYDAGQAFVELECRGAILNAWWTDLNRTQETIVQAVTEDMRGGFTLRVTYVRENIAYVSEWIVDVPWTNKQLTIAWERFRSLLEPGQKETWTAIITGPDAGKAVAEMVAALYDASLDQYLAHDWIHSFSGFRSESSRLYSRFENSLVLFNNISYWYTYYDSVSPTYRHFSAVILPVVYYSGGGTKGRDGGPDEFFPNAPSDTLSPGETGGNDQGTTSGPDLSQVAARENLDETAFFFPHLLSDSEGVVRMEFTMPEALTQWKFLGFAHDRQMRSGYLTGTTVTAKDLMVEPNPPRFVREGDVIEFTVKVTNRSPARQTGLVMLTLQDARTLESRDEALGNSDNEKPFDVPSMESRTYSWRLTIPDGCEMLIYKAVGATTRLSDGEQGYLPVLSRRILVTESLPLPIRGAQTKDFEFTSLLNSGQSDTLRSQSLTVQMVSQPAWYAVMALPYLMEYPYQCSEQIFNRLYANALASYIANSDPQIRRIFDQWKATPALDSPLEKNEDLKGIALEETPWVRQAIDESEARRNVGILFDQNRLTDETSRALFSLSQMQGSDGLWPWLPGLRGNEYITLYIVTGFGRLRHLGATQIDTTCAVKALDALDKWMDTQYRWILEHGDKDRNNLSPTIAFYLYGRSFFLADKPIAPAYQEARDYWLGQARQYWLSLSRQSQAHVAIGLKRFGDLQTPAAIMQSIKEHSVTSEELGMFWRDTERSWWWYHAPIETQAMMIEAFDEVMGDAQAVEDCRVWLLKQKQTQDWSTTKATADAIYALLLRGTDWLASTALVQVALAGQWITPENVEAGTGFYEERFVRNEITPDMGHITVKKTDDGVSWGSVHWQYLEDMTKVAPYEGTPLQLHKAIYVKKTTETGPVLFPVDGPLAVGDELVVRIELRVDRDMEYVHMKDQRGSGTEPVSVLSQYRYQDGLAYYESTRDTASHFFMDYLPKGTYVFEYSTRIQHRGQYQTGIASIQCMYAPEFNSHSESFTLEVQ